MSTRKVRRALTAGAARSSPEMALDASRRAFLLAVETACPHVLADLAEAGPDGVEAWAARWHLAAPWVLAHAREALALWHKSPEQRGRSWASVAPPAARWGGVPEELDHVARTWAAHGWRPLLERRAAARDRLRADFERWVERFDADLDCYLDQVEVAATEAGLAPATQRDREHYRWTAWRLCAHGARGPGLTLPELARAAGAGASTATVAGPVRAILAELELQPPRGRGRPRKSV